jgi:hypothetical protein
MTTGLIIFITAIAIIFIAPVIGTLIWMHQDFDSWYDAYRPTTTVTISRTSGTPTNPPLTPDNHPDLKP